MKTRTLVIVIVLLLGIAVLVPGTKTRAQVGSLAGRTITGTVYFVSGRRPGLSLPFTLIINRITTAEEVSHLNAALQEGKQDELLRELSHADAGRIQIGSNVGVPANAIIVSDQGNGQTKITVLYQRDLRFSELRRGARSVDYPFGYAEMYVGRGDNEGMLIPAARVRLKDGNTWEVEDFGTFPARLMGLKIRGRSPVG